MCKHQCLYIYIYRCDGIVRGARDYYDIIYIYISYDRTDGRNNPVPQHRRRRPVKKTFSMIREHNNNFPPSIIIIYKYITTACNYTGFFFPYIYFWFRFVFTIDPVKYSAARIGKIPSSGRAPVMGGGGRACSKGPGTCERSSSSSREKL